MGALRLPWSEPFLNRPDPDLPGRLNAELEHDVSHVGFDISFANYKHLSELAITFSLCNQASHLALAYG